MSKWLYRLESTDPGNGLWYNDEGFTKAQAIHFTDLFLAGILGRIG